VALGWAQAIGWDGARPREFAHGSILGVAPLHRLMVEIKTPEADLAGRQQAYAICSLAVDLKVAELVDVAERARDRDG
jgi:hypothetical protein